MVKTLINDGLKFVCSTEQELWRARTLLTKEPGTIAWLNRVLKPGDVFYDIGANVGCYTLYAARIVGETGKVYAFEPHPANALALLRNIGANGFHDRVHVITAPLARCSGLMTFRVQSVDAGTSHHGGKAGMPTMTWATSLDEWCEASCREHRLPTAIKIDVDGPEVDILMGAMRMLIFAESVQVECEPSCASDIQYEMERSNFVCAGHHYTSAGQKQIDAGAHPATVIKNLVYEHVAVPA
jgi:FkbM family methyltransferase